MKSEELDIEDLEGGQIDASKLPFIFNLLRKTNLYKQRNVAKNKVFNTTHFNLYPLYKPIRICVDLSAKMKVKKLS